MTSDHEVTTLRNVRGTRDHDICRSFYARIALHSVQSSGPMSAVETEASDRRPSRGSQCEAESLTQRSDFGNRRPAQ